MEQGLSSFDIYVIVSEFQNIRGSYIEKFYQTNRNEVLIKIKTRDTNQKETIFIRNGELICRTQHQFTMPEKPSSFTMMLRKYVQNGTLQEITQQDFDRIIRFSIMTKEGRYTLICELFKNGNVILLDSEEKIIQPLYLQHWALRTIKPHELYTPPPAPKNPFNLSFEEFEKLLKESTKDLVRTIATTLNFSGIYAEELCLRAGIDKNIQTKTMDQKSIEKLYQVLQTFLEVFTKKDFHPVFIKEGEDIVNILPIPFLSYNDSPSVAIESYSLGLEEFINKKTDEPKATTAHKKAIEKLNRQLIQQQQSIEEFEKAVAQKKMEGDLIYLQYQLCQDLLDQITLLLRQKEKDEGIQTINKNPFVKTFDPVENTLVVFLSDDAGIQHEISLDFRKNVSENAQQAYEDSKKHKEKIDGAKIAIIETQKKIETLQAKQIKDVEKKKSSVPLKRFWFESYRWCISSEGNVIVGGRDVKTNEQVVKKYLGDGDRYVHADVHGAPSCVVKNQDIHGKIIPISEKTLEEACIFGACFSKAWKQYGEAQAYWVLPEQVSKTPESGEFLPKGAFIIRGKRNYVRCPMQLAIGQVQLDGGPRIMAGSIETVKSQSEKYVVISPGTIKSSSLSHLLSKAFDVSSDDVLRVFPPGNAQITQTVGLTVK